MPKSGGSEPERWFAAEIAQDPRFSGFQREFVFSADRKWRADFAWPAARLLVEIEGITSKRPSRHQTYVGFQDDCIKYDAAARLGWVVYRCTPHMVYTRQAIETVALLLARMRSD